MYVAIKVVENRVKFCRSGRFNNGYLANAGQEWIKNYETWYRRLYTLLLCSLKEA